MPWRLGKWACRSAFLDISPRSFLTWITTKAPVFGSLVARREYKDLDRLFNRTLLQAMSFLIFMSFCCMFAVIVLNRFFPSLAGRLVSPRAFALLLVGTLGSVLVQSIAIYLRSFKREPFLWQSVAVAVLTLLVCRISVRTMGTMGISISYLVIDGGGWRVVCVDDLSRMAPDC